MVDKDGFLQDSDLWNEDVAKDFATTDNISELTKDHWNIINYIRNYYESYGIAPMIRKVCKETGFNLDQIYGLFPSGPAKGACKVAGLPKPAGCV
jgi:tRNA 2-thiouridine synthesizing protein E